MEEHAGGRKAFRIGRLCTKRSAGGQGHTTRLLRAALAEVGRYPCRINAQTYLADMYAQHGFVRDGEDFLDDGVPHVPMLRRALACWTHREARFRQSECVSDRELLPGRVAAGRQEGRRGRRGAWPIVGASARSQRRERVRGLPQPSPAPSRR